MMEDNEMILTRWLRRQDHLALGVEQIILTIHGRKTEKFFINKIFIPNLVNRRKYFLAI